MPLPSKRPPADSVEKCPSVWFLRLEEAIRDHDVRKALLAKKRLGQLGFEVELAEEPEAAK